MIVQSRRVFVGLHFVSLGMAALLAVGVSPGLAQSAAHGEFQINSYGTSTQAFASVASQANGAFVVTWNSYGSPAPGDSDAASVQGRRFTADGSPIGLQFLVNSYTTGYQGGSAVAIDGTGGFVVVWASDGSAAGPAGNDHSGRSIQAQRYANDGSTLGSQFQINTYSTSEQSQPAIAMTAAGDFIVAWASIGSAPPGNDSNAYSVQARRYLGNGTPIGSEFQVNTYTTGNQRYPAVGIDGDGGFVVAWQSTGATGDNLADSIQAQRFDATGATLGSQFLVNTYTTGDQTQAAIAVAPSGDFVVAWTSYGSPDGEPGASVHARRFDATGAPQGIQFKVNTLTTGYQGLPAVAADSRGDFIITWHGSASSGTDTSPFSIQARRFRASGAALGSEFQVNVDTPMSQVGSVVAVDGLGNFVVVWDSQVATLDFDIRAQRFDNLLREGFESGNFSRWSSVLP
ncbi:MAG: hypothetical protein ABI639_11500 [Thermoanaerobaculia bacterium]